MTRRHPLALLFAATLLVMVGVALPRTSSAIGLLIPQQSDQKPFQVERHRVDIEITNSAAVTTVEQVFRNHTRRPMEATFVFPLPAGATVSDFSLWINGKKTQGAVLEKDEARKTYESIVRRLRDPGLVEYMDGRLFKASIFPIPPNGTQKLELKFSQVLDRRGGFLRYTYPMGVGEKYVAAKTKRDFTLTASVEAPVPISTVYSPTHEVSVDRAGDKKAVVGAEQMEATLDRDFQLYIGHSKKGKNIGLDLMVYDPDGKGGNDGYFMASMAPNVEVKEKKRAPQAYTFVIDTSGSMSGEKIKQARETLAFCIERLEAEDLYNVVRFSTGVETLFDNPKKATKSQREKGRSFAEGLRAAGGTSIDTALERALAQEVPEDRVHQVIFVTDGIPTIGQTNPDEILKSSKAKLGANERIFSFGVGYDVNTKLMDGLARHGRGHSDYVKPGEDMEQPIAALYTRISSPVLSDVEVDFGKARVYDAYPTPLPDLFRGDQIVMFGRYRGRFASPIELSGEAAGSERSYTFKAEGKASTEEELAFVAEIWATRKVGYLLEQIRLNGENEELKSEVIRLAKKFGLVTPYTSYLAVDDSETGRPEPRPRPRPRPNPPHPQPLEDSLSGSQGVGGGANAQAAPEPSRSRREAEKKQARGKFRGFGKSSGQEAVEAAEATQDYKDSDKVDAPSQRARRHVAGRTFERTSKGWIQQGLEADAKGGKADEVEKVVAYSDAYFQLLRKHPELQKVARLGGRIRVKVGETIYQIVPE